MAGAVVSHVNLMAINFGRRFVLIINLMSCQKWLQIYVAIRRAKRHLARDRVQTVRGHRLLHFANEPRAVYLRLGHSDLAQAFQARGMWMQRGCGKCVAAIRCDNWQSEISFLLDSRLMAKMRCYVKKKYIKFNWHNLC